MTGALNVTGTAEKLVMAFPPIADYGGALQAATTILGVLIGRKHGGGGAYLDVVVGRCLLGKLTG